MRWTGGAIASPRTSPLLALAACLLLPAARLLAAPVADFSRVSVQFGYVSQGVASPASPVFVTNVGDAALVVSAMTLGGARPGNFQVSGTCGPPVTLAPGERCRIDVVMTPLNARGQPSTASLAVETNAAPAVTEIALTGTVDPILTGTIFVPRPEWLDFAPQPVGTTSSPRTLTITNTTSLTFTIGQFALVGDDGGDFQLTADCAADQKLLPKQTCTANVIFTPRAAGPRSTELATQLTFLSADGFNRYSITGVGGGTGPASTVNVIEYYNAALDHYFITWVAAEQAILDAGNTPTRWNRTGASFKAYTAPQAGTSPVCRYYIPPAKGDSHFFGRGTVECNATGAANPTFVLEDPQFMHLFLPVAGVCPAGTTPVSRVFSNRPDANHRYMTDPAIRDQMVARGWLAEGDGPNFVVMCAP